jgi:hypothetical protein
MDWFFCFYIIGKWCGGMRTLGFEID